jgi:outer membrane protein TolC
MSRSRWIKRALAGVLTLSAAGGCKQQLFMDPGDYHDAVKVALPKTLETNPHDPVVPATVDRMSQPTTVLDFVRPARHMTLRECIALALEQGNSGIQQPTNFGFKNEGINTFAARTVGGTDAIRAFAIDPALAQAEIERSLSRFDTRWVTTMQWAKVDQPTAAQFLSFQNSQDTAVFNSTLAKPLPTGGVAGITFSTNYSKFAPQAAQQTTLVNPNYTPQLQFTLEQPLLRLFGVEINQIANTIPLGTGSVLLPGLTSISGNGTEGILITRIRLDQSKANFESQVNYMMANVEAAYWNLYAAYYNLYAQEEGLRQAFEGYRFTLIRVLNGTDPPQRLDQIQAQFHRFQRQVYQARGQVLEGERQLRGLIGLRSDDGVRLVPIDEPNLAPYQPDFHEAANDAIALRPELMLARQDLKFQQLNLMLQKNLRRPDLRGYASYNIAGLGTRLGGSTNDIVSPTGATIPGNAFGSLADNRFNSWTIGFRFDVPLGFRDANGLVREAQLSLTRSYVQLRDSEMKAIEYLSGQYRRVIETHAEIAPARAERESLQRYIARIREVIRIGSWNAQFFLDFLTVQQQLATAIAAESQAIANYNIALASFEFAKGTIQQYNNVSIGEGPLPPWVSKRAKDHFRERTDAAIKLREQPLPPGGAALGGHPVAPAGAVSNSLLNLPPFAEKRDPVPEMLPPRPPELLKKNPMGLDPAPEPRPLPGGAGLPMVPGLPGGAQPFTAPRPQPTFGVSAPAAGPGGPVSPEDYFKPDGRITIPPPPPGARPAVAPTAPPLTGTANGPDDFFKPDGRVALPPPPPVKLPGTTVVAPPAGPAGPAAGNPEDYFKPDGRVTLPPPPKRAGEPIWAPSGSPAAAPAPTPVLPPASSGPAGFNPPAAGTVSPLPPIVVPPQPPSGLPPAGLPPTLPPLPGVPGGP